jgi:hypothetical protein
MELGFGDLEFGGAAAKNKKPLLVLVKSPYSI